MGQCIKSFADGTYLAYGSGSFDNWCVYLGTPDGTCTAPKDEDYFQELADFAQKYGAISLYSDFVKIYNFTGTFPQSGALSAITEIAAAYGVDAAALDRVFTTLYMAMIAEERKAHTRLGKRIKRLGVHMLLIEGKGVSFSAHFTRGKSWQMIDSLCRQRGF